MRTLDLGRKGFEIRGGLETEKEDDSKEETE